MEIFEIGKLEVYINAGQEARVPIAAGGPEGRHLRAAAEARTYAAASSAVAEEVLPQCSGDTAQRCCPKIDSGG
jgi:hypothetical protein